MSFVKHHWSGDTSLARAFWVNFVFITALFAAGPVVIALLALVWLPGSSLDIRVSSVLFFLYIGFSALLMIWQSVGLWRSSGRHVSRGGRRIWSALARAIVVLMVLRSLYAVPFEIFPQSRAIFSLFRDGDQDVTGYVIRHDPETASLFIAGGFRFGLSDDVRRKLETGITVRRIVLESSGGRLGEAESLFHLIDEKVLDTHVDRHCASACAIAHAGGRRRTLGPEARLGYHRPYFPGTNDLAIAMIGARVWILMDRREVSPWFVRRMMEEPSDSMWYPDPETLRRANLING